MILCIFANIINIIILLILMMFLLISVLNSAIETNIIFILVLLTAIKNIFLRGQLNLIIFLIYLFHSFMNYLCIFLFSFTIVIIIR